MQETRLTFESKSLVVDWIGFNIQGSVDLKPIAKYLFEAFGFNSTIAKRINGKWKSQDLKYDSKNQFQISFRQHEYDPEYKSFWVGTQINFSGENATYLYSFIKEHQFNWNIFELQRISLARLDLHYFRQSKARDSNQEVENFMEKSCQMIRAKSKRIQASWTRTKKGCLLRIGNRSSSNFYRVYQKDKEINYSVYSEITDGLQFELELKKEGIKSFQEFLFANQIEEFEGRLVEHFYKYSKKYFVLDSYYTDWLRIGLRKIFSIKKSENRLNSLVNSYLKKESLDSFLKKKQFFNLHSLHT